MLLLDLHTRSEQETLALGKRLGGLLPAGALLLLKGDLGAGKTCLTKGIAGGLGVDDSVPITSPTYTLLNCYTGRLPLYHFDLYRLASEEELEELGFDEYFHGEGVAVVEWPERCPELQHLALNVEMTYVDATCRHIVVTASEGFCREFSVCCAALSAERLCGPSEFPQKVEQ